MFNFENLDQKTRSFILEAIQEAEFSNNIYYSSRFNDAGKNQWLSLLKQAASKYNEHWLAYQLESNQLMTMFEGARKPSGGYTIKHVPHDAAYTLAEGQFNRFYILGLCKRARIEGITQVEIYRAKLSLNPRPESELLIGTLISIDDVESQLKVINDSFKSPLVKPNSGLSVKFT